MREELPKGQSVSASPWQIVTQYCALGVRVDVSGYGDGLGFLAGEPHPDALIVAEAIRALGDARFADRVEVLPLFGDLAAVAGGAADAILGASFDQRGIVISHATMGTRPKWKFDEDAKPRQMFVESINERDEVRVLPLVHGVDADGDEIAVRKNRGRARMRDGEYNAMMFPRSPLEWCDPMPISIAHSRAEFVAWHAALAHLANVLDGALKSFAPAPLALPLMPWLSPTLATRVIFRDAFARYDTVGLPLQPKREAGRAPIESPIEAETRASYGRASREKMRRSAAI
jgi:hypothetical protein